MSDMMTPENVKQIVTEALTQLGFDLKDPTQIQRDMAFLRDLRKVVGVLFIGMVTTVAAGVANAWHVIERWALHIDK